MSKCIASSCEKVIANGRIICNGCGCDQRWALYDSLSLPNLIKCKTCKGDVSLKAELCPNCREPQTPKLIEDAYKSQYHPQSTRCPFCREANVWCETECRRCGMRLAATRLLQDNEHSRRQLTQKAPKYGFITCLVIGILVLWFFNGTLTMLICITAIPLAFLGFVVGIFCPSLFSRLITYPPKSDLELEKELLDLEETESRFAHPPT